MLSKRGLLVSSGLAVVIVALFTVAATSRAEDRGATATSRPSVSHIEGDVCPPFFLRDEDGNIINPVAGTNVDKPYSPKQTCGACHDYDKITEGYHFQQGADEKPTELQAERCQWASTPGNYGGTWCSPAPLYRSLASKHNETARTIDMTSFDFITVGCGKCHPGGGPMEYDREGHRYDRHMADPASGLTPGGENNLDGDYYKARWSETGVLEADCLLCHLPEYNFSERNKQLGNLNFRWVPTAAAVLATVEGAVKGGQEVKVTYNTRAFDVDGRLSPHIVREPRDETCLQCHAKPGWKKRGANFRSRTDVHLAAGLKCVDCHPAGSKADDPRIHGDEVHQFAKGDDPGGHVRDDLDNTVRDCDSCHTTGEFGAPVAKHPGLPPLHLERIACETCHIPQRFVKAAQVQAGDVFNPGAKIPTKGKHLWTFYGPEMKYWNHYGDLEMMGYDDKPTDMYRPVLARYKGKIFPVNRVHSAWPGIEVEGKPGLAQPLMSDVYKMWTAHRADPAKYPELAKIQDDNSDGVIEVNRPEEIDALIASVTAYLADTEYPLKGKRVVWASNERVYASGTDWYALEMLPWEASVYGNVHKYSHDVLPARSALGSKGCTECHSMDSPVLFASVVQRPFDEQGAKPVTMPQYRLLGLSRSAAMLGAVRESYVKPAMYLLWLVLIALFVGLLAARHVVPTLPAGDLVRMLPWAVTILLIVGLLPVLLSPSLRDYALPSRAWLDSQHFPVGMVTLAVGVVGFISLLARSSVAEDRNGKKRALAGMWILGISLAAAGLAGLLMGLNLTSVSAVTRYAYSVFDIALVIVLIATLLVAANGISNAMPAKRKTGA